MNGSIKTKRAMRWIAKSKLGGIKIKEVPEKLMLEEFKDNKHLVRMSPFLVATAMGS